MHYVVMGIMKENSYSGIQRHWFCQTELNKQFALSKTTYKLVLCGLSNHPWTIIKKTFVRNLYRPNAFIDYVWQYHRSTQNVGWHSE